MTRHYDPAAEGERAARAEARATQEQAMTKVQATAQHTPGPWTLDDSDWPLIINEGRTGAVIAYVGHETPDIDLAAEHPNARLIAAAPDLLAALEMVATITHDFAKHSRDFDTCDIPLCKRAHAAIRKAKSE